MGHPILAKNEYLMRHDKVCTHLHYSICKALGIETADKWYTHVSKPVYEEGDVTVLWNQAVHTNRESLSFLRACCYIHFSLPTHALIN